MAFSYSDKNFTVVGNLCFVHIVVQGKTATYAIPQAIRDRMLVDNFACAYYTINSRTRGVVKPTDNIGCAVIYSGNIECIGQLDSGYLYFYFPIDSNK